jgi:glycosyltransferase involved in cell wall biosynthesis
VNKLEKTSLSVIVPVYNERFLVAKSLNRLFVLDESPYLEKIQIIIVNDCSDDESPNIIKEFLNDFSQENEKFEWIFISHEKNLGKGKAIQTALKEATCEITIIHDADLEYNPKDILRMIPLFIEEEADAVFGSRFTVHEYRRVLMFRHELGNRFLTFISNLISNLNLTDMETCYKAVRTRLLKNIPIKSNDFRFEPELTIKLAKRNAKIFEIPINYSGRTYQEGKKINWIDGVKAMFAIIKFGFSDDIFVEDEYGSRILARLSKADKFNAWMAEILNPYIGQNVLEIGSGIGNITRQLIPRTKYVATDINEYYLDITRKLMADKPYLRVEYLDINDVTEFVKNKAAFDTVICLNVIEHLDDDLKAMRNIAYLMADNGRAVVLVPRGQWLFGSLDIVLGHKRRYSEQAIKNLSQSTSLKLEKIIPFNRISSIPWFINGRVFKKKTFGQFQIFFMNLLTPVFKLIDRFIPLPSLSYIAVFKKYN